MSDASAISAVQIPALRSLGAPRAMAAIVALSVAVVAFLFWLIYFKGSAGHTSEAIAALPAVNAGLNALATIYHITGYLAVRRRRYMLHVKLMFAALASSTLFFVSYVIYHNYHGDTKFLATGPIRPIYFFVLITHIVLSVVTVPMILTSLYLSLSGRLATHKRVSRWTLPVWLYVSITGVLIFLLLKVFNVPAAA
jgi:putative membrane protein